MLTRSRGKVAVRPYEPTPEELEELALCHPRNGMAGLVRFCSHVSIPDKKTGRMVPFIPWKGQIPFLEMLVSGLWVFCLKARQLGITTCVSVFCIWGLMFRRFYTVTVLNQNVEYADEFIEGHIRLSWQNLPDFIRLPLVVDSRGKLQFSRGSTISSVAATSKAARSRVNNLLIADEAARIERLRQALNGAEPTLEKTEGQCVVLGTADGPVGAFYEMDKASRAGRSKYHFIFLPWWTDPNRNQDWYDKEVDNHRDDPTYIQREYPSNPDEPYLAAGGRIYPKFTADEYPSGNRLHIAPDRFDANWLRFRTVDWGETISAFVCLWVAVIPSEQNRLTYDPTCVNFEREMLGYSNKPETEDPMPENDHCPDALRILVATCTLQRCWVHVYRELYVDRPTERHHTAQSLLARVKEMSGFTLVKPEGNVWSPKRSAETYTMTVFDRSRPMLVNEAAALGMVWTPHQRIKGVGRKDEVKTGIMMVNALVGDTMRRPGEDLKTEEEKRRELGKKPDILRDQLGIRSTTSLEQRILLNARKRRRDSGGQWRGLHQSRRL